MIGTELQRGRFLAVVVVLGAFLAGMAGQAQAQDTYYLWLDCYENYMDSADIRSTWSIIEPDRAELDLECEAPTPGCPNPHCDTHNTEGPAWEGCQYMRINYLTGTNVGRMAVNPPADWTSFNPNGSGTDYIAFRYRGRHAIWNGTASLQLRMESDNGSPAYYGPVIPEASNSPCDDYFECPWYEYQAYVAEWPGLDSVTQVDLIITFTGGPGEPENGRIYIDCVHLVDAPPVSTEQRTWGAIKSLYR